MYIIFVFIINRFCLLKLVFLTILINIHSYQYKQLLNLYKFSNVGVSPQLRYYGTFILIHLNFTCKSVLITGQKTKIHEKKTKLHKIEIISNN